MSADLAISVASNIDAVHWHDTLGGENNSHDRARRAAASLLHSRQHALPGRGAQTAV